MKSTIRQMFFGERGNCNAVKPSKEYKEILSELIINEHKLKKRLQTTPAVFKLYRKISDIVSRLSCESETTNFVEGFRFGVLLGIELVQD